MSFGAPALGFPALLLRQLVIPLVLVAAGAPPASAGPPEPAPPLSEADLDRLRQLPAWDIVYTHTFSEHAAGSGDLTGVSIPVGYTYGSPSAWNATYSRQYSFTARFTVAAQGGSSDCAAISGTSACVARYQDPATWTATDSLGSYTGYVSNYCEAANPNAVASIAESYSAGGSKTMTGADAESSITGAFVIDYSVNPPTATTSLRAAPFPATFTRDYEFDCFPLGDVIFPFAEPYRLLMVHYSPFDDPTTEGGDTQVRLENGKFVIRGGILWDFDLDFVPRGSPQIPETRHPGHRTVVAEWVVREHEPADLAIVDVKLEQQSIPEHTWQPVPEAGTVDGNEVRVIATVRNDGGSDATAILEIDDPVSDEIFTVGSAEIPAGETRDFAYSWDSTGAAWEADGAPRLVQPFGFELSLGSSVQDLAIRNLAVQPRPVVLVHGLVSNAATWSEYQGFLSSVRGDWKAFAVGDGQAPGVMNTGSLGNPLAETNTIGQNAAVLDAYLEDVRDQLEAHHVDIVGHSMGGLISRFYIQQLMAASGDAYPVVRHLVTLGTPHRGSPCADLIFVPAPAIAQLRTDYLGWWNTQVTDLKEVDPHGLVGIALPATCQSLEEGDGVVPRSSATFFGDTEDRDALDHLAMTKNADLFHSFVKPRLSGVPAGLRSGGGAATAAAASAAGASGSSSPQLVTTQSIDVPAGETVDVALEAGGAGTLGVTLMAPASVASALLDPEGSPVSSFPAGSAEAQQPLRSHSAAAPEAGAWILRLENTGTSAATVPLSAWVLGSPLVLDLAVGSPAPDGNTQLAATFTNDGSPIVGAQVTAHVEGLGDLPLLDDGAHGDGAPGDGSYGAETGALGPGLYPVIATATAPAGARTTTGLVNTEEPLAVPAPGAFASALAVLFALAGLTRRRSARRSRPGAAERASRRGECEQRLNPAPRRRADRRRRDRTPRPPAAATPARAGRCAAPPPARGDRKASAATPSR